METGPKPATVKVANNDRQFKYGGNRAQTAHLRRHRKANGRAAHPGWPPLPQLNQRGFPRPGFAANQGALPTPEPLPAPPHPPAELQPGETGLHGLPVNPAPYEPEPQPEPRAPLPQEPAPQQSLQSVFEEYALYGLAGQAVRTLACTPRPSRPPHHCLVRHRTRMRGADGRRGRRTRRILGGSRLTVPTVHFLAISRPGFPASRRWTRPRMRLSV